MKFSTLSLLLLVSSVRAQDPTCQPGALLCGGTTDLFICVMNENILANCVNGECQLNTTSVYYKTLSQIMSDDDILIQNCLDPINACNSNNGGYYYCATGEVCDDNNECKNETEIIQCGSSYCAPEVEVCFRTSASASGKPSDVDYCITVEEQCKTYADDKAICQDPTNFMWIKDGVLKDGLLAPHFCNVVDCNPDNDEKDGDSSGAYAPSSLFGVALLAVALGSSLV